jgi:hypothetical protein
MNLFSFMMGALWAFFNQSYFGKRMAGPLFLYFGGLAVYYWAQYQHLYNAINK